MVDYNVDFGDISRGYLAAQTVVKSTRAGKSGLVKVTLRNGKVQFFSPVTNSYYDDFNKALDATRDNSGRYLTSLDLFAADEPLPGSLNLPGLGKKKLPAPFAEDRAGSGRQIFRDMIDRINNLTANEKKILIDAGIDVDDFVKHGQMFQATFSLDDETMFGSERIARKTKFKEKESVRAEAQSFLRRLLSGGDTGSKASLEMMGQGIQVLDSSSSVKVIGFRLSDSVAKNGKVSYLNSYQANLLASVVGNDFLNPEIFGKMFSQGDPTSIKAGSSAKFSGKALKIAKRLRASFGDRPISLAGDDIHNFISNALDRTSSGAPKVGKVKKTNYSLVDHILVSDFEFDVMRNWAFDDQIDNPILRSLRSKEERALYKNLKSGNYVDSVVGFFTNNPDMVSGNLKSRMPAQADIVDADQMNALKAAVRDAVMSDRGGKGRILVYDNREKSPTSGKFGSEVLMDELEDALRRQKVKGKFLTDDEVGRLKKVAGAMMKQAELAKDGADIANVRFFHAQVKALDANIKEIEEAIADPALGVQEKLLLKDKLETIKRSRRSFQSAIDHGGQVTGRISVGGMSTAKNIVAVGELVDDLKDIAFILNKTSFKKETAIAGRRGNITEFINLSGMVSDYADNVKVDYAAAAAHGSIFATKEHFEAAKQRSDILMTELDDALENNVFSPRIRSILERTASSDAAEHYEDMNEFARMAATRAREQARTISEFIQRGGNISENVELANALFDIVGRDVFRYNPGKDETKVVMANVYRFGIDSEAGLLGRSTTKGIARDMQYQASEIFLGGKNGVVDLDEISDIRVGGQSFDLSEEIIKFRIADHKVLLSEDAVARYMHALGGFDLDDKALPIITRFQTSNGVEKLAFNLLRQPTGPEESMFLLPNFDAETVRSLLGREEMKYALNSLQDEFSDFSKGSAVFDAIASDINARGLASGASASSVRVQFESSMRLLKSIMEGDGAIGGLYNYEDNARLARNVEQAFLDLLRYSEASGFTTISDVTERQAKRIKRFGTSSLFSAPGVDEVGYTSQGIFKLLDQEGVFDITDPMTDALRQAGYDQSFIDRFINYTAPDIESEVKFSPFDAKMRFLAEEIDNEHVLSALYSSAMGFNAAKNVVAKSEAQLGAYINASMVVSSMLDQYQDFLIDVNDKHGGQLKAVYNKLLEYNIGLISQESAIDISVNQGGSRSLAREQVRISTLAQLAEGEYAGLLDTKKLESAISKLHDSADLKTLNEGITPGIIKQTAFIRTLSESMGMGYQGGYGFDYQLFKSRMLADPESIVEYMAIYSKEMKAAAEFAEKELGFQVTSAQRDLMDRMDSLYFEFADLKDAKAGRQEIDAKLQEINIFLKEESGMFLSGDRAEVYANVSRLSEYSAQLHNTHSRNRLKKYRENMKRQQQSLDSALSFTSIESRLKAKDILATYSDELDKFRSVRIADLVDAGMEEEIVKRFKIFGDLFDEIDKSSRLENVSKFDILTAIDAELLDRKIDISVGKMLPDIEGAETVSEMIRSVSSSRNLRSIRQSMNNDIANVGQKTYERIAGLVEPFSGETFAERLQGYVDANTKRGVISGLNEMEQRLVQRFLAGGAEIGELESLRRLARENTEAGRLAAEFLSEESAVYGAFAANAQYMDNIDEFNELTRYGTTATEAELAEELGDAFDEFNTKDVEAKNTQYKRIGDKLAEKDFIDFIKRPAVKKTLYGMGALIAFSFGYQAYKDRTQADMTGPPLLPGGSAYETQISPGGANMEDIYYQGYNPGVSYQVSLHGNQDSINSFRQSVGDLNYGNLTTTMYSNLPRLGRDLYADVAPDF